jgi:glutathione S-transferase
MDSEIVLVSHKLCPYVQRVAIVLQEKGVRHERRYIDLARKPPWFLEISPLGKTPVLLAGEQPIFESAVICEYLDDVFGPRMHPQDALQRAKHRSWIEFASTVLSNIAQLYSAGSPAELELSAETLRRKFEQVERVLGAGPFFDGPSFSIVDAAFAPVFRYFDVIESRMELGTFQGLDHVQEWRQALRMRPSVQNAADAEYPQLLERFLLAKGSELSRRMVS